MKASIEQIYATLKSELDADNYCELGNCASCDVFEYQNKIYNS